MIAGPRRFQPRTRVRSGAASSRLRRDDEVLEDAVDRLRGRTHRVVVRGDRDELVLGGEGRVHRRVEARPLACRMDPDDRRVLVREQGVAERAPHEARRHGGHVDLVTGEVEQLDVDDRQPGLAAGLGDDPRDQVAREDQLGLVAADHPGNVQVGHVPDLGDDVIRLGTPVGVVGDREDRLDHAGVGVGCLRRQHHDRARRPDARDLEVADVDRIAGPADHPRPAGPTHAILDRVLHLDLVAVGQDHDRAVPLVGVRDDELGDDREDLLRPAEDHRVAGLDHAAAALAQLLEAVLEAGHEETDEDARHEDAGQRGEEHRQQEPRPVRAVGVVPDRAGVDQRQDRPPQLVEVVEPRFAAPAEDPDHEGHDDRDGSRHDEQPGDQGRRAPRHQVVDAIPKAIPERGFRHVGLRCRGRRRGSARRPGPRRPGVRRSGAGRGARARLPVAATSRSGRRRSHGAAQPHPPAGCR